MVRSKGCPNYDPITEGRPAASPPALRKGCAFPLREATDKPDPRRPEGYDFQAAWIRRKSVRWAGKAEPLRRAGGEAPSNDLIAR